MYEDVGLEHGESIVDGHTQSGAQVVGHGGSGAEIDDEGNGSQAEPQGQADEGHGSQNENEEYVQVQESGEGFDEDEDYPIPAEWRKRGFGNPVVHDAKQQQWEYTENEGAIAATWNQEVFGYGMVSTYTGPNEQKWYIPNPSLKRGDKGRLQTRCIRNGMDEAEAGKRIKLCTQCGAVGHNYNKCLQNAFSGAAEAGPSGNATDGAPPSFELPSASRARPLHSVMAEEEPTPELLDPGIDSGHRSYMSAVEHKHLATFQCRPPKEYLELDNRWLENLFTLCRLIEGGPVGRHGRPRPRLAIDNSLITVLVDRWRPETHTFHLSCGEMAPTLQDAAYLLGLPIAGDAIGPRVVPSSWRDDLELRFAGVDRLDHLGPLDPHPNSRGLAKNLLLLLKATNLHPDIVDDNVSRSLEAYLLWLFGFMMFKNGTSNSVDKVLKPYAQEIADAPEDAVPIWSWASAVLAATYRGLCDACIKDDTNARFQRCALLLQLRSYERLAIGRPIVDHRGYEEPYCRDIDDDGPTMGTLWVCPRERTWTHEQARRTYPAFVVELNRLVADDALWEPYSAYAMASRAPLGLSSWCTSDVALWYTTASLVYDICIEAHYPDRVMRQFGYAQQFLVPRAIDRVSQQDHRYLPNEMHKFECKSFHNANEQFIFIFRLSRLGQPCSVIWVQRLQAYIEAWDHANEDVVQPVGPHTDAWYQAFLRWY
ncbi:hypothetical protein U9M48_007886 [Paspalum notatum var. saurae]|uniref:Aminotransferase-like plant mobile domain-containing protein n=1 Tax=Paspalum notatum var. saurae TaxID=547442 RepID=A0AAQ3WCB6_PASNO